MQTVPSSSLKCGCGRASESILSASLCLTAGPRKMHILASQRRSAACAMVASLSQAANALSFGDSSRLSGKPNSPLRLIYIWNSAAFSLIRRTISWTWHASRKQFQHLLGVKHAHRHACGCRPGLCASSVQASNLWVRWEQRSLLNTSYSSCQSICQSQTLPGSCLPGSGGAAYSASVGSWNTEQRKH